MSDHQPLIELRKVTKSFKAGAVITHVLQGVNLTIHSGEFIAIVGPSGSGKTTLTHIIGGLSQPSEGQVLVDGRQLRQRSDRVLSAFRQSRVGFVFQNFNLLPDYTVLENASVPLVLGGMKREDREKIAKHYLVTVGLQHHLYHRPHQLSGGQRQRVAIARALAAQPDIVIADEPTGSLDIQRGEEIISILRTLNAQHGVTLVLVTHNPDLAQQADRIIAIEDGKTSELRK